MIAFTKCSAMHTSLNAGAAGLQGNWVSWAVLGRAMAAQATEDFFRCNLNMVWQHYWLQALASLNFWITKIRWIKRRRTAFQAAHYNCTVEMSSQNILLESLFSWRKGANFGRLLLFHFQISSTTTPCNKALAWVFSQGTIARGIKFCALWKNFIHILWLIS